MRKKKQTVEYTVKIRCEYEEGSRNANGDEHDRFYVETYSTNSERKEPSQTVIQRADTLKGAAAEVQDWLNGLIRYADTHQKRFEKILTKPTRNKEEQ